MLQDIDARIERALTPELIADFRRDGAVCIRKLFTEDDIALLL